MKTIKSLKKKNLDLMKDPDQMWELRMKFLERIKHYYGVPYGRKYHGPDSPDYNAPLYLDCCGLVRQVLLDMKEDFGFRVGRWNQAYQCDTLPITVHREEDMKPGDLVFVSAIFYNPKLKAQLHNLVHVEVWAGEGSKSIGARWQKGHVQLFDSYMFEAKSYHSMVYHFKSIDTWLQGVCKSHCPEHPWRVTTYEPGQKSIFSLQGEPDEGQAAQDAASDTEEEDDGDHDDVNNNTVEESNTKKMSQPDVGVPEADVPSQVDPGTSPEDEEMKSGNLSLCFEEDSSGVGSLKRETANGCRDIDGCHDDSAEPQDGNEGKRKGSTVKDKTQRGFKSSADRPSPQKSCREKGQDKDETPDSSGPKSGTTPRASSSRETGPAFYIGGANGVALVEEPLVAKGWHRIHDRTSTNFKLKWVELKSHIHYHSFKPGEQLVNRIPNTGSLATKVGLQETLREYERVSQRMQRGKSSRILKMENFYPESFVLDNKADREAFFQTHKEGDTWISKPNSMNQGKGIYLVKDITGIQQKYQQQEESGTTPGLRKGSQSRLIQRYIPNPLLLEGKKFDVRAYLLIACTTPYVVFYHPGYLRLSCDSYDPISDDLSLHLTNQYVQKKNPGYQDMKEDTVWSMDRFNDHVNSLAKEKGLPRDWVHNQFTKRMTQIMTHCFNAVKNKLQCKLGYFDLLGFDFLLDEEMKVWLLEVNVNPALHTNCETLRNQLPPLVQEVLDVVLEIFDKCRHSRPIMPLLSQRRLTLLYNEGSSAPATHHMSHSTSPPRQPGSPTRNTSPTRGGRARSTSPAKRRMTSMTALRKNITKMSVKDTSDSPGNDNTG
ncbi:protein polyglycylase TTLL10-like [Asterias rubens]|uniref:protein polyglycylase TTLL10-like n=1 Tax=Asterias rubens TaxID=7604 RepID=UPI0014551CFC|nr:protein polyglycylase TTLL10-like [Asterias rubens]